MTEPNPNPTPPVDPPPTPPADPTPTPPVEPTVNPPADNGDRLDRLENLVTGLVETVSKLIPGDDKPTRKPWTHYGSRDR
jgi:hypothetical protein